MKLGIIFVAGFLLLGCPREPVPPPQPSSDAGIPVLEATCAGWCAHATELACDAAKPTPAGSSCEQVCENIQRSGVVSWNLKCRVAATSCSAADACESP